MKKHISAEITIIIGAILWSLRFIGDSQNNVYISGFATLGTILLLVGIITLIMNKIKGKKNSTTSGQ